MFLLLCILPLGFILGTVANIHEKSPQRALPGKRPDLLLTGVIAGVLGVACQLMWLSRGSYDNGGNGPILEQWQFIGCGICLAIAFVFAGWLSKWPATGPFAAAIGMVIGFTLSWSIHATSQNMTFWDAVMFAIVVVGSVVLGTAAAILGRVRIILQERTQRSDISPTLGNYDANHESHRPN